MRSTILVLSLSAAVFAGCGDKDPPDRRGGPAPTPVPTVEKEDVDIRIQQNGRKAITYSPAENPKRTRVTLDNRTRWAATMRARNPEGQTARAVPARTKRAIRLPAPTESGGKLHTSVRYPDHPISNYTGSSPIR